MSVAPPPVLPQEKCETVPDPPVPAGKSIFDAGLTLLVVTVKPEPERATFTRAYDVYPTSLVLMVPASPGSPVHASVSSAPSRAS